jgi:hypothetical protein
MRIASLRAFVGAYLHEVHAVEDGEVTVWAEPMRF